MTTDPQQEAERIAALAESFQGPHEKRMMRMISESWERMGRDQTIQIPQYERD